MPDDHVAPLDVAVIRRRAGPEALRSVALVLLSDRDIRAEIEVGRVRLEPDDAAMVHSYGSSGSGSRYQGHRRPTRSRSFAGFHRTRT